MRAVLAPLIIGLLFAVLGILGLQRARSSPVNEFGSVLLGLAFCFVALMVLLVIAVRLLS